MITYFDIEEFHNDFSVPTLEVRHKIQVHIDELNPIRELGGFPITISKGSGYRSKLYEMSKGRSGTSEHCFLGKGAVDLTCGKENIKILLKNLLEHSTYTRICYYPVNNFIHCDWKLEERNMYICDSPKGKWYTEDLTKKV